jgi:carboxylate-amine ligase
VRRRPERFVAQELVPLSTHPTVVGAGIAPRRVDLRAYVVSPAAGEPSAMQGGLTRYAREAEEMVVDSSRGGGAKDTWVLGPEEDVVRSDAEPGPTEPDLDRFKLAGT